MPKGAFRLRSFARSDVGRSRRKNEDYFLCDDELGLWLVADGMGGHAAGEIASRETAEAVFCEVKSLREENGLTSNAGETPQRAVERAVQAATYQVFGLAEQRGDIQGMGTTLSALVRMDDSLVLAQVGDSRIYRLRDRSLALLTEDHTLVNYQLKHGLITEAEAKHSRQRNVITRAVGHRDYVEVDTEVLELASGDCYLLCSDGLHGYFNADELGELLSAGPAVAVQQLVDVANDRGGKDNITAVVVEVCPLDAP